MKVRKVKTAKCSHYFDCSFVCTPIPSPKVIHTVVLMAPDGELVEDPNTLFEFAAISSCHKWVIPNLNECLVSRKNIWDVIEDNLNPGED